MQSLSIPPRLEPRLSIKPNDPKHKFLSRILSRSMQGVEEVVDDSDTFKLMDSSLDEETRRLVVNPAIEFAKKVQMERRDKGMLTVDDVRAALSKSPSHRSESDLEQLTVYFSSLNENLFAKLSAKDLRKLCSLSLWLEEYQPGDIIYRQGEESSCCHVIINGAVGIWVTNSNSDFKSETSKSFASQSPPKSNFVLGQCVATLTAGGQKQSLGEMGVLENQRRTANIRAEAFVELVMIDKSAFDLIIRKSYNQEIEDKFNFLRSLPLLAPMSDVLMQKFAMFFNMQTFAPRQSIYRSGDLSRIIYFIVEGTCEIVHIEKTQQETTGNTVENGLGQIGNISTLTTAVTADKHQTIVSQAKSAVSRSLQSKKVLDRAMVLKKCVLSILGPGALLGADTAISSQNNPHIDSAIALSRLKVYAINYVDFFRRVGTNILSNIRSEVASQLKLRSDRLSNLLNMNKKLVSQFEKDVADISKIDDPVIHSTMHKSKSAVADLKEIVLESQVESISNPMSKLLVNVLAENEPPTTDTFESMSAPTRLEARKSKPTATAAISNTGFSKKRPTVQSLTKILHLEPSNSIVSPSTLCNSWWNENRLHYDCSFENSEWESLLRSYEGELWALDHLFQLSPLELAKENKENPSLSQPLYNKERHLEYEAKFKQTKEKNINLVKPEMQPFFITETDLLEEDLSDENNNLEVQIDVGNNNHLSQSASRSYLEVEENISRKNGDAPELPSISKNFSFTRSKSRRSSSFEQPSVNATLSSTFLYIPVAPSPSNYLLSSMNSPLPFKESIKNSSDNQISPEPKINIRPKSTNIFGLPKRLTIRSLAEAALDGETKNEIYSARTLVKSINDLSPVLGVHEHRYISKNVTSRVPKIKQNFHSKAANLDPNFSVFRRSQLTARNFPTMLSSSALYPTLKPRASAAFN